MIFSCKGGYVVGIGASAGGLESIQAFFAHMPQTNELSFIVLQHLPPDFTSMMGDLLLHYTEMPIVTVENNTPLSRGIIYLIPPAVEARIENNCFMLSPLNKLSRLLLIDILFESIAAAYKRRAIGVILSGTGSDGALGVTKIAKNGGLTFVQAPAEAKFADMPAASIATKKINAVLPVAEIPDVMMEYIQQSMEFKKSFKHYRIHICRNC